ncbi:MAG: hypothetical protein JKP98_03810 [Rhodobacteraceae bacterium]|nr:hypothetical protein [Paracoccaceae bacterium]
MRQYAFHDASDYDFTYDHAGRLLRADNRHAHMGGFAGRAFRYDPAGNMTFHSRIGDYRYDTGRQRLTRAGDWAFQYDANGNTTRGLYGKAMTYDGENRPLSVTLNGVTTRYVYAADGSRLLRIDRPARRNRRPPRISGRWRSAISARAERGGRHLSPPRGSAGRWRARHPGP